MESIKALNKYWFGYGSPVSIGVFRILMSSLIFINLAMIGIYFTDWFGQAGYMPAWLSSRWLNERVYINDSGTFHLNRINLLAGVSDDRVVLGFFWLTAISALFSAAGLWTRFSTIIMAIGVVSIQHRTTAILHGGDTVMRVCAIYLAIAPSGAAVSLDRWLARRRGTAPEHPPLVSMWPQRLIQFNLALVYFTTVWSKWFGPMWKSGIATWYPARLNEFKRFPVPAFVNDFPFVYFSTYGTLFVEFALGTLIWFKPLRKWVLLAGIGMHGFIEYSMNIPLFAFLMTSMYICFYEGDEVSGWWDRVKMKLRRNTIPVQEPT